MIKRLENLEKLKDKSLQVPWLGKLFDFSKMRRLFHFPRATPDVSVRRLDKAGILRRFLYNPDILCILLVIGIAFLFARNPGMDLNSPPAASDTQAVTLKPPETRTEELGIVRKVEQVKELKTRNIFTTTGSYSDTDAVNRPLPEKPYKLIGVLNGKEMKAVFAEYTGSVVTMTVGKKMLDGFVISKIKSTSVKLTRGKEEKELRTFDVLNPEQTIEKKMADGSILMINKGSSPTKLKGGAEEGKRERAAGDIPPRDRTAGEKKVDRSVKERRGAEEQDEIRRRERDVQMRQQTIPRKP
jgi:hypothetical protein